MYQLLDIFFFAFHTALILFVLLGWLSRRTRLAHFVIVLLTAFSWFVLGIWYGFGYCPCTDWHWQVRQQLGDEDLPFSYIKFLIDRLTGWDVNPDLVNVVTVAALAVVLVASTCLNVRSWLSRNRAAEE